jgi:hypothetical protein
LGRFGRAAEHVRPGVRARAGETLDLGRGRCLSRILAQRLGERDEGLIAILDLLGVEASDVGEQAGSLAAACRTLDALEQGLDQLFELAEPAASSLYRASAVGRVSLRAAWMRAARKSRSFLLARCSSESPCAAVTKAAATRSGAPSAADSSCMATPSFVGSLARRSSSESTSSPDMGGAMLSTR